MQREQGWCLHLFVVLGLLYAATAVPHSCMDDSAMCCSTTNLTINCGANTTCPNCSSTLCDCDPSNTPVRTLGNSTKVQYVKLPQQACGGSDVAGGYDTCANRAVVGTSALMALDVCADKCTGTNSCWSFDIGTGVSPCPIGTGSDCLCDEHLCHLKAEGCLQNLTASNATNLWFRLELAVKYLCPPFNDSNLVSTSTCLSYTAAPQTCLFQCAPGWYQSNSTATSITLTCTQNQSPPATWSATPRCYQRCEAMSNTNGTNNASSTCQLASAPGSATFWKTGDSCTLVCNSGYVPSSSHPVCNGTVWSVTPQCIPGCDGSQDSHINLAGSTCQNSTMMNNTCTLSCSSGYAPQNVNPQCVGSNLWANNQAPLCLPACDAVTNSNLDPSSTCSASTLVGQTCTLVCKSGFSPSSSTPKCLSSNTWDVSPACSVCSAQCTGKQCGSDSCLGTCGVCAADQDCTSFGLCSGRVWLTILSSTDFSQFSATAFANDVAPVAGVNASQITILNTHEGSTWVVWRFDGLSQTAEQSLVQNFIGKCGSLTSKGYNCATLTAASKTQVITASSAIPSMATLGVHIAVLLGLWTLLH